VSKVVSRPAVVTGWQVSLYPDAGEASASYRSTAGRTRRGSVVVPSSGGSERSRWEAARRAKGKVRRYGAANRLNRFGTLTYRGDGCHDPQQVRTDIGRFFRRLRRELGEPFPYVWVPELHPGGHGLHVHFVVGRFVHRGLIEDAWGHGFIKIKLIGDLPAGSGPREEARVAARYISKYLGKDFTGGSGLNRYDVAQGFQPAVEVLTAATSAEAIGVASERMGGAPNYVWRSEGAEEWFGPDAVWMSWR